MWELILEWCAAMFGVTVRSRLGQLVVFCVVLFVFGLVLASRWGPAGWMVPALLILLSAGAAHQVGTVRNQVWRTACLPLDEPLQRPPGALSTGLVAPTASTLVRLAEAVDAVRRGRYVDANELLPHIQRNLLRREEVHLVEAVRAMISVGLGSTERAAQQAATALPTGSDDLDTHLGRTLVADAWNEPERLVAIERAWDRAGIRHGPLSRLGTLVRIRVDGARIEDLSTPEARALSDEARAIGDDELAAELEARSRAAYR